MKERFRVEGWVYDPKTGKYRIVTSCRGAVRYGPPVINIEIEKIPISAS